MTQLDRYILKQILAPSLIAFFVIAFLAVSNEIRERADTVVSEVLKVSDIMRLSIYFLPTLLSHIVPIAFFFGILIGLGHLSAREEISAINSAGISMKRIMAPIVLMGGILALACMVVQDRVQPLAIAKAYSLMKTELPKRMTVAVLQPGVFHEYAGWRIYFRYRDPLTETLYDVDIVQPDEESGIRVFHAETASLVVRSGNHVLRLGNGYFISPDNLRSSVESQATFESQELIVPSREEGRTPKGQRLGMNLSELLASERQITLDYDDSGSYALGLELLRSRQEIADRLSLPFAALAFSFAGIPIALKRRRGSRAQLMASGIGVLMLYYLLRSSTEPRSLHDLDDYILRVWIPNLILIGFGSTLIWHRERLRSQTSSS